MRELVYYVAVTLDGFIAHPDGSFDKFPWDADYGADLAAAFPETLPAHLRTPEHQRLENRWFDAVLMGRATYEVGLNEGFSNPYPTLRQYVFSRSYRESPDPHVTLVSGDAAEAVRALKQEDGKAIWLCGGSELATTMLTADLIDRLILKLNPVVFGSGIPLFAPVVTQVLTELTAHKSYPSGHMVLHYRVKR
jgi:dihydrofolate reductase